MFIDLAAHERTHPGEPRRVAAGIGLPRAQCVRYGSDLKLVGAATGLPRPDGAGVWMQDGHAVPFFAEYDTGSERLDLLTGKVDKYALLFTYARSWAWPVQFMLPSVLPEQHWHDRLPTAYRRWLPAIIATTAADYLIHTGKTPAEDVWQVFGNTSPRQRLIGLPYTDPEHDAQWSPATPR